MTPLGRTGLSDRDILLLVCILAFLIMLTCCCGCAYYCMKKRGIKLVRSKPSPPTSYAGSEITAVTSAGRITLVGVDVKSNRSSSRAPNSRMEVTGETAMDRYMMSGDYPYEHSSSEGYSSGQWMDDGDSRYSPAGFRSFDMGPLSLPRPAIFAHSPTVDSFEDIYTKETTTREEIKTYESTSFNADDKSESEGDSVSPKSAIPYDPSVADGFTEERPDAFFRDGVVIEQTKTTTIVEETTKETTDFYEEEDAEVGETTQVSSPPSLSSSMRNHAPATVFVKAPSVASSTKDKSWHLALVDVESQVDSERTAPVSVSAPSVVEEQEQPEQLKANEEKNMSERLEFDPGSPPWGRDIRSPDPSRKFYSYTARSTHPAAHAYSPKYDFTKLWLERSSDHSKNDSSNTTEKLHCLTSNSDSQLPDGVNNPRKCNEDEKPLTHANHRSSSPDNRSITELRSLSEAIVLHDVMEQHAVDPTSLPTEDMADVGRSYQSDERPHRFVKNEHSRNNSGTRYRDKTSTAGSMRSSDHGNEDEMRSVSEMHVADTLSYFPEPDYDLY